MAILAWPENKKSWMAAQARAATRIRLKCHRIVAGQDVAVVAGQKATNPKAAPESPQKPHWERIVVTGNKQPGVPSQESLGK